MENPFGIRVSYHSGLGKVIEDNYLIDFSVFLGLTWLGTPPLHKIADNIEKINNNIDRISSGFNKINVIVYTKEDIEAEYAKHVAERIEMIENQKKSK
ncbi:MAG: hypothetical protein HZA49_05920 [Planctomycetes bacterium]|nr:hypothetical protein [Planctomycetota bacterium]